MIKLITAYLIGKVLFGILVSFGRWLYDLQRFSLPFFVSVSHNNRIWLCKRGEYTTHNVLIELPFKLK